MGGLLSLHRPRAFGRRAAGLVVLATLGAAAASCGSSTTTAGTGPSGATLDYGHVPSPAGPTPSESAKMICKPATQTELAYALGIRPVAPVHPTWIDHLYTCRYVYRGGVLVLSVKEMSSQAETTAYYDAYKQQFGDTAPVTGLGQGGFVTRDGSVVVRKDYKVLFVDVAGLPAKFGSPPTSPGDVAITVADVVMACWDGR
jgi:hypothetical protein